jgi:cytochrome b561
VLGIKNQEDIAGVVHYYLAYSIIIFVLLHALAALKHHFIDQDVTLKRMTKTTDK